MLSISRIFGCLFAAIVSLNVWSITRVACIGNSITEGIGASSGNANYPSLLKVGLGTAFEVKNFGISGSTMSMNADAPYMTHSRGSYQAALAYKPNIVIIKLGTNDAANRNWNDKTRSTLKQDYTTMVKDFQALSTTQKIFMCLPCYLPEGNTHGKDEYLTQGVIPIIREVAEECGCEIIDCHTPFVGRDHLLGDLLHPNDLGYTLLAYVIGKQIKVNYPKPKAGAYQNVAPQSRLSYLSTDSDSQSNITDCSRTTCVTLLADATDTLTYHLNENTLATAYSITCGVDPLTAPRSWVLQCSSTGTSGWRKVHEMKDADFNPYETRVFHITTPISTGAKHWRLIINQSNGQDMKIYELQLFGAPRLLHKSLLKGAKGTWSAQSQTIANEGVTKLSDGVMGASKYCTKVESDGTLWVRYDAPEAWTLTGYGLISGDYRLRNRWPSSWKLEGSNDDGENWQLINSQSNQFFGGISSLMEYTISAPASYKSYRLTFRNLKANQYLELAELQFYGMTTTEWETVVYPIDAQISPERGQWYQLNGCPVKYPTQRGIYIKDGKKVIVK